MMAATSTAVRDVIRVSTGVVADVTVFDNGDYLVKNIESRDAAFLVAGRVMGEFGCDPESGNTVGVTVSQHCDDSWKVWVEVER